MLEPGRAVNWVPSNVESALFGTKMTDEFFTVHTGGDVVFINGARLKVLLAEGGVDRAFVRSHTEGFDELLEVLERESFTDLERQSGASRTDMGTLRPDVRERGRTAILVWSMGITQHERGSDNVAAIANLGLAAGNVGRRGAGVMPIRGHSGVQGGAGDGGLRDRLPGAVPITPESAAALSEQYGFPVGGEPGMTAEAMIEAASRGDLDVLYSSGGNFLEVLPGPRRVHDALRRVPLRVHQDIVVSSQMLVEPGEVVVLLPAATRYEQRDGGTETTTERRIAFSPEIPGHQVGEARSEWEIFLDVAKRFDPDRAHLVQFDSGQAIRARSCGSCRRTRASSNSTAPVTPCSGAGRDCARTATSRRPTARRTSSRSNRSIARVPDGQFLLRTRRGSSSTRWSTNRRIRSPERDAMRCSWRRPTPPRSVCARVTMSSSGRMSARCRHECTSPRSAPGTCRFFPKGTCCSPVGGATARRAYPTTTRWCRSSPRHTGRAPRVLRRVRRTRNEALAASTGAERRAD